MLPKTLLMNIITIKFRRKQNLASWPSLLQSKSPTKCKIAIQLKSDILSKSKLWQHYVTRRISGIDGIDGIDRWDRCDRWDTKDRKDR